MTRHLLVVLAYLVAALCLFWVFRGVNLRTFIHQFQILKPGYLALAIFFNTAVYFSNTLRWCILLRPIARVRYWRAFQAVYVGLYLNEVLPLRPGEVARCYLLSRRTKLPLSNMFASAALERMFEGLWTLAGFFAVTLAVKLPRSLVLGARVLAISILVITCVWIIHVLRGRSRQKETSQPPEQIKTGFFGALQFMGNARIVAAAMALTCLSLICLILAMWFLMKGGGFNLSVAAAATVFFIIRVGIVVPNAPGNIGSYQFFCVLAMGLFGVSKSAAAAFSLLTYSIFTVPLLIGGTIVVIASDLKLRALANRLSE